MRRRFKAFIKREHPRFYQTILFLEQVNKREAIYISSKQCGDSQELIQDRLSQNGDSIKEKFLDTKEVELPEELLKSIQGGSTSDPQLFDEAKKYTTKKIEELLQK